MTPSTVNSSAARKRAASRDGERRKVWRTITAMVTAAENGQRGREGERRKRKNHPKVIARLLHRDHRRSSFEANKARSCGTRAVYKRAESAAKKRKGERMKEKENEFNNGYCFRNHAVCNRANKIGKRRARASENADWVEKKKKNRLTIENDNAANFELGIFDSPPRCRFDTANGRAVPTISRKPFLSFTIVRDVYREAYIRLLWLSVFDRPLQDCFYALHDSVAADIMNSNTIPMSRGE